MKHLALHSPQFQLYETAFAESLEMQNYKEGTINNHKTRLRELFNYLETKGVNRIEQIKEEHLKAFVEYISSRENTTKGGGLSTGYVNNAIKAIKVFLNYLHTSKGMTIPCNIKLLKQETSKRDILTIEEMNALLQTIETYHPLGKREMAIVSTLYGSGLRKSELENLKLQDVSLRDNTIRISGKGNKERIVPVPEFVTNCIKDYITHCRDYFEDSNEVTAANLFIEHDGTAMKEYAYYQLIKKLILNSGIESIQNKDISLHTFRHSIATHLLQQGMEIEDIAQFLGHANLDTTMIYTHIIEEYENH